MKNTNPDGFIGELNQTFKEVVLHLAWVLTSNICICLYQDFELQPL